MFILFIQASSLVWADDDWQQWSELNLKLYKKDKIQLSVFSDFRLRNDARRFELYFFSPRLSYKLTDNLSLGLNYSYLQVRGSSQDDFRYQHRIEPEINPQWVFLDGIKVQNRNRVEFRWIEDQGSYNTRIRDRLRFVFPLVNNEFINSVYIDTEFFYNVAENQWDEQRTTPIGLNFNINDKVGFQAYYRIQHKKSNTWRQNNIIGTMVTINF